MSLPRRFFVLGRLFGNISPLRGLLENFDAENPVRGAIFIANHRQSVRTNPVRGIYQNVLGTERRRYRENDLKSI